MANQKRNDTRIGNIDDLPSEIKDKFRKDAHLGTVLKANHVASKNQLKEKFSEKK